MTQAEHPSIMRRALAALLLAVSVGSAFKWRNKWQPDMSFRASAAWVARNAPGQYGDALRTIAKCVHCDDYNVSLRERKIELANATLTLNGTEALRVDRAAVTLESKLGWNDPFIFSVALGSVRLYVEARDLLLKDTNWHHLDDLNKAVETLSSSSSSSEYPASGVRSLRFEGVARCDVRPPPVLGGAASTLELVFDFQKLEPLSEQVARAADENGGAVTLEYLVELAKLEVLRAAQLALARALDERVRDAAAPSQSKITLAGVNLDLFRPKESLRALAASAAERVKRHIGLDDDAVEALAAAAALLRVAANAPPEPAAAAEPAATTDAPAPLASAGPKEEQTPRGGGSDAEHYRDVMIMLQSRWAGLTADAKIKMAAVNEDPTQREESMAEFMATWAAYAVDGKLTRENFILFNRRHLSNVGSRLGWAPDLTTEDSEMIWDAIHALNPDDGGISMADYGRYHNVMKMYIN